MSSDADGRSTLAGVNVPPGDQARLRLAISDLEGAVDPRTIAKATEMTALLYPEGSPDAIEKAERDRRVEIRKQLDHLREWNPAAAEAYERARAA